MTSKHRAAERFSARQRGAMPPKSPRASAPFLRGDPEGMAAILRSTRNARNRRKRERQRQRRWQAWPGCGPHTVPRCHARISTKAAARRLIRRSLRAGTYVPVWRVEPRLQDWVEAEAKRLGVR